MSEVSLTLGMMWVLRVGLWPAITRWLILIADSVTPLGIKYLVGLLASADEVFAVLFGPNACCGTTVDYSGGNRSIKDLVA
jgi:hypothetical protein